MRTARHTLLVLFVLLLAAIVVGCGSDSGGDGGSSDVRSTGTSEREAEMPAGTAGAPVEAKLDIEMKQVASKDFPGIPAPAALRCTKSSPATCSGTIECPTADDGSVAPTPAEQLCTWIATIGAPLLLEPEPEPAACTMQYGGPEVATVTGTIGDRKVDATFSREDGCAINRFDQAAPLWTGEVPPTGGSPAGDGAASGACLALPPDTPVSSDTPPASDMAADGACATPAQPAPPAGGAPSSTPPAEPEIISDPPEAFDR